MRSGTLGGATGGATWTAESLLAQRKLIADAITAAEGELPKAVQQRLDAEAELAKEIDCYRGVKMFKEALARRVQ